MDYVAIAVTPGREPQAQHLLGTALDRAGVTPTGTLKALADNAAEILVCDPSPGEIDALQTQLSVLAADTAFVPAAGRRKRLLVCDMDSTIIQQECLDELADFAGLKAEISAITEQAMRGELNFEEALTTRVGKLVGLPLSAIDECYRDRIRLSAGAQTLVRTMAANDVRCLLVSGGFTAFTRRVAQAAGFHEHHANTLIDDGDALVGKVEQPILGREAKLDRLNEATRNQGLTPADAMAIGDGANDLAMIEAAGLGIAYRAKPIVADRAAASIELTDLTSALYFQGYTSDEFVSP